MTTTVKYKLLGGVEFHFSDDAEIEAFIGFLQSFRNGRANEVNIQRNKVSFIKDY